MKRQIFHAPDRLRFLVPQTGFLAVSDRAALNMGSKVRSKSSVVRACRDTDHKGLASIHFATFALSFAVLALPTRAPSSTAPDLARM